MPSIDLGPPTSPYFPTIFFKNQFLTKTQWPSKTISLRGKTAITTGANSGLGFEASGQLLALGLSRLIMAVRSTEKGEIAASKLKQQYGDAVIDVWVLDMSSYESVKTFVRKAEDELPHLDIVVLNAGQYNIEFKVNQETGHEETVQVNYLSTWLLAILLLPLLKPKSSNQGPGRLTIVNAALAYVAKFSIKENQPILPFLDDPRNFEAGDRYPTSKLLSHFFMTKLRNHVSAKDVIVNMVCPGLVADTGLQRQWPVLIKWVAKMITIIPARSVEVGASTYVDAIAVKGEESHMSFLMNWQVAPFAHRVYEPEAKQIADRLWEETMTEFKFADVEGVLLAMKS